VEDHGLALVEVSAAMVQLELHILTDRFDRYQLARNVQGKNGALRPHGQDMIY
jgi:hypothetical protein